MDKVLNRYYIAFWLLSILIGVAGEYNWLPTGLHADNVRIIYCYQVVGILLAASLVPVSLKLFNWMLVKKISRMSAFDALKRYGTFSILRLGLLAIVVVFNLLSYYLILSTTCILCACIALLASLFCIPSDRRLREELHISNDVK